VRGPLSLLLLVHIITNADALTTPFGVISHCLSQLKEEGGEQIDPEVLETANETLTQIARNTLVDTLRGRERPDDVVIERGRRRQRRQRRQYGDDDGDDDDDDDEGKEEEEEEGDDDGEDDDDGDDVDDDDDDASL
jgi:hypothetical protein